jgi:hypothetical protein
MPAGDLLGRSTFALAAPLPVVSSVGISLPRRSRPLPPDRQLYAEERAFPFQLLPVPLDNWISWAVSAYREQRLSVRLSRP